MSKPCPFCGSDDEDMITVEVAIGNRHGTFKSYVECQNCRCVGPTHWDGDGEDSAREGAIYLWESRNN